MASLLFCIMSLVGTFAVPRPSYAGADAPNTLAAGSKLYVRLVTPVSTKTSHLNQLVTTNVVREVKTSQGVLVPLEAEVTGKIAKLIPASAAKDHARLLIQFTQLILPRRPSLNLAAHLTEVENARETVLQDGTIQGVLATDAAVGRMDGWLDKLGWPGSEMARLSGKALGRFDNSIDYPTGTDMVLTLDQNLTVDSPSPPAAGAEIPPTLAQAIEALLAEAPQRVQSKSRKPGDPLNLVIVGSAGQILDAFKQAGWDAAKKLGATSAARTVRAVASDGGYSQGPVSQLYLFGRAEDLAFEKMLNTFMKRHHLRLWRTTVTTADGREIWLGASTHDVGLDVHRDVISHSVDPDLDAERAKVGADLMAGGSVAAERLVSRPHPITEGLTATGGPWKSDGQLLLIDLKASSAL